MIEAEFVLGGFKRILNRATSAFGESGDLRFERFGNVGFWIELFPEPFADFGMALMFLVADPLQQFRIARGAADIFWRTALAGLDQPRVRLSIMERMNRPGFCRRPQALRGWGHGDEEEDID